MKKTTSTNALRFALFAAAGAAACAWAPQAAADDHVPTTDLGTQADVGGGQQWTVTGLQPSADQIAAAPAGSLWEATATAAPADGGVPIVPGFAARTPDGQDYPVMWNVPTPLGINPSPLAAGETATGKLYFDVTGSAPDSVTYNRDGQDAAVWVQPPPPVSEPAPTTYGSGSGASTYVPPMQTAPAPMTAPRATAPAPAAPAAPAPATPAPAAAGSSGTPAPAAAGTTPPATSPTTGGSAGTPQPATGSVGTPATPGSTTATPAPTTPAPAGAAAATPTPQASTSPAAGTAPAGGTPAPAAAPTTPPPASAPLPGNGSSGTPFTVPTTTPVPAPAG